MDVYREVDAGVWRAKMNCPRCQGKFEKVVYKETSVDRCLQCKGLWFDILEAESLRKVKGADTIDIGDPDAIQAHSQFKEIKCPRCYTRMTRLVDNADSELTYEKCPVCYGVWFDAGKFRHFRARGLFDTLKQLIGRGGNNRR